MSTSTSAKKLQRLVLAQTVTESIAKSQVGLLSSELAGMEQKLTMTRDSFAKSKTSLLFADLHLKHIHNLVEGCNDLRSRLENARQELQSETVRQKKLQDRLKTARAFDQREEENKLLLEQLDRSARMG